MTTTPPPPPPPSESEEIDIEATVTEILRELGADTTDVGGKIEEVKEDLGKVRDAIVDFLTTPDGPERARKAAWDIFSRKD